MKAKQVIRISLIALCLTCGLAILHAMLISSDVKPIAMIMKIIQEDVQRKTPTSDWQKAKRGDPLESKDMVKTGTSAFAVVKFNDNTLLKIRPNSEITIFGEIAENNFSKSIHVDQGSTDFDVVKQKEKEKFEFTTPTSVASIRGTNGRFETDKDSSDYLFINSGLALLLNILTNQSQSVGNGQVGISHRNGVIEVRIMTKSEASSTLEAGQLRGGLGGDKQNIEMDFKDNQGNPHKLILEVQKKK